MEAKAKIVKIQIWYLALLNKSRLINTYMYLAKVTEIERSKVLTDSQQIKMEITNTEK